MRVCVCGLGVALLCVCTAVLYASCHKLSDPKQLQMSAMEATADVRAKTKAKAEPTQMRLTPEFKAASDHCADLAAYRKKGEVKVRRSILDARKQEQADKRMHHRQSVTIPDSEGWVD